jgi:Sulfatase-modifying factor enzyme 1
MDSSPEDTRLGDYRLKELLAESPITRTWLAEQIAVQRYVLIDELRPEMAHLHDSFLADIRAKAAVDHPLIGSVYEAVSDATHCFFARERLPGITLRERLNAEVTLKPLVIAHLLNRVSEAQLHLESRGQNCAALDTDDIHHEDNGVIRIVNLALAGVRPSERSRKDITALGTRLVPLVAVSHSGATRTLTLLAWMRGEGVAEPLTWQQVHDYAGQIEQQLTDSSQPLAPATTHLSRGKKPPYALYSGIATCLVLALGIGIMNMKPSLPPPPVSKPLPEAVIIPAGKHPTPDGGQETLRAFLLSTHEVTIGQYAEFLNTLDLLSHDQREHTFDEESQPPTKSGHQPTDWANLYAAAKSNGVWMGQPVTLDTPVVGVDWWDAMAFCGWKQGRLPTEDEWYAALRQQVEQPSSIKPSKWLPVTAETPDRTPIGLIGMAGSVAEWTRLPGMNPANPLGQKLWVIIGGSYLKPANGALAREWTENRAMRRPDLGFRLATDEK